MISIKCKVNPYNNVPVICDTIDDFYKYESKVDKTKVKFMRVYIIEVDAQVVLFDEHDSGIREWGCTKGCIEGVVVPIKWRSLEEYRV
ncbi:hypothetical protein D3C87_1043120 [compost metagenome]